MNVTSFIIQNPSDADQRIDKFLRKYLPNAPLGGIFKWLRTGKIKVNGEKVSQTYRILLGDSITFYFNDDELEGFKHIENIEPIVPHKRKGLTLEILLEDEYILVINKPAGINVHPGDHKSNEASLIEQVQDYLGNRYNSLSFKPSLVHRIDRDTSGCIIIAKEKKSLEKLLESLQNGKIKKTYHALVKGLLEKKEGTIHAKLLRIENATNEAKVRVDTTGQTAITHYKLLKAPIKNAYSLIECEIETGRTHQIRVHLAHIHHPILGDKAYGDKKENSFARREYHVQRQLLHAYSLVFPHPVKNTPVTVIAPYMPDMEEILR